MDLHDVSLAQRAAQADNVATLAILLMLLPLMHPFTVAVQPLWFVVSETEGVVKIQIYSKMKKSLIYQKSSPCNSTVQDFHSMVGSSLIL
jgi:hypothetical protein